MAYFNHAFHKILLGTGGGKGAAPVTFDNGWYTGADNGIKTIGIPPACIAPVTATAGDTTYAPNTVLSGAGAVVFTYPQVPQIYLAQGSINTKDKLGPFAGGYQETVKTKGINPRYVTKFWKQCPFDMAQEMVSVCVCDGAHPLCGTSYYLRVDIKGSPALRFLTHNIYKTFASSNVCCPADPDPNDDTAFWIDPMLVQSSWAWQIARDPIMSQYILPILTWNSGAGMTTFNVAAWYTANPTLTDTQLYSVIQGLNGDTSVVDDTYAYNDATLTSVSPGEVYDPTSSTVPCMYLVGAYVDTEFGTCSFHPQDHYELQPIQIYTSITDQQGDPCVDTIWCFDEVVSAQQGSGYGYKYIRDLVLFRRYMQENYVYDPRLREVMDQDVVTNSFLSSTSKYVEYNILHSVPRFNNPTGVFDNDQYMVTIVFPCPETDLADFEAFMQSYIDLGNTGVTMEIITGDASGNCTCTA